MPVSIGASENTFSNPIALLSDCHRRIERFLNAMLSVAVRIAGGPLDAEHRRVLEAALKYFREAAPKHSADEEEDLFPSLRENASPRVLTIIADVDRLEADHRTAEAWHYEVDAICRLWLSNDQLSPKDAARLRELLESLTNFYRSHIAAEEQVVFPVAQAALSDSAKQAMGRRMAERRGVLFIPERAILSDL